ncbi:MAG: hypothetical protein QNK23_11820 [Crocinitomicaceae bacterium]|nr:hypothetical protein [Crocinitomicaceae bacterium]
MKNNLNVIKSVVREQFRVDLRADGLMHVHFFANTTVTIELQSELEQVYETITQVRRPFIYTGDEFVSITSEARANAIKMAERIPCFASAIVVQNLAQKIIADYYYRFNKPPNPYKVFRKFDEGISWVKENYSIPSVA